MKKNLIFLALLSLTSCFVNKERSVHVYTSEIFLKELKIPLEKELGNVYPQKYNLTQVKEKRICDKEEFCINFLYVQALLANSKLRFIKRPNERHNMYQQLRRCH